MPAGAGAYGSGRGTIWLDDVTCFGNETTLMQCDTSAPGDTDCTHKEDVGVICLDSKYVRNNSTPAIGHFDYYMLPEGTA